MGHSLKASAAILTLLGAAWSNPVRADWRDDIGTFRVGIVAEPGAGNTVPGLAPLTDAYTKALGMKVEFVVARDYAALMEGASQRPHRICGLFGDRLRHRIRTLWMRRASCGACRFRRRDRHPLRLADAGRQGPRPGRDGSTSGRHRTSGPRRITRWPQPSCAWRQVTADSNGDRSRARSAGAAGNRRTPAGSEIIGFAHRYRVESRTQSKPLLTVGRPGDDRLVCEIAFDANEKGALDLECR